MCQIGQSFELQQWVLKEYLKTEILPISKERDAEIIFADFKSLTAAQMFH